MTWAISDYEGGPYAVQDIVKDAGKVVQIASDGRIEDCTRKHFECVTREVGGLPAVLSSGPPINLAVPNWWSCGGHQPLARYRTFCTSVSQTNDSKPGQ